MRLAAPGATEVTGADFQAEGHRLAAAYALIRPNAPAWLAAWQAGDAWAADELSEWELEGHPFHHTSWSTTDMTDKTLTMTTADVLDGMLALYAAPGTWTPQGIAKDAAGRSVPADSAEAVAWSLEGALERVIGDIEDPNVVWSENARRQQLLCDVFEACGVDLAAFGGIARHQRAVVSVLRAGRA